VLKEGFRVGGTYFAAACLETPKEEGARIGFAVPRALGKAVVRNRLRRRAREAARRWLERLPAGWQIVIQPRRAALEAPFEELAGEMEKLFRRCAG